MIRYARITFVPEIGKTRGKTVTLRIVFEDKNWLRGYEVRATDGEEITGKDFDRRLHIIDKTMIAKRVPLVMNKTFGTLERER